MFPRAIWTNPIWCLYDNTSGKIILKHPWQRDKAVRCPYCGEPLDVQNYRATCCGQEFRTSFGEIAQRAPFGTHTRETGCGWSSLRPFQRAEARTSPSQSSVAVDR